MVVENKTYELVIIGGGILGLMSAYLASKEKPEWSIVVIDKKMVGNGATAYSAFLDMPYGKTQYKRNLTRESRRLFREVIYPDMPYIPVVDKVFIGYASSGKLAEVANELSDSYTLLTEGNDAVKDAIVQAPLDQKCLRCDSASYVEYTPVRQLYEKLIQMGVRFMESVTVKNVTSNQIGYCIETDAFGSLNTRCVIEATGPFSIGKTWFTGIAPIAAKVKKIIAFHISGNPAKDAPISYFFEDDAFLIPQPNFKRWLFSYRCADWDIEVDEKNFYVRPENVEDAKKVLKKYAPELMDNIIGGRVFCDLYSENGDPIVESISRNFVRIGAAGGSGYRLAPGLAQEALRTLFTN